jgi:hypothetical protein
LNAGKVESKGKPFAIYLCVRAAELGETDMLMPFDGVSHCNVLVMLARIQQQAAFLIR